MLSSKNRRLFRNAGLLILRVGLGIMFILHGYPKLEGGPDLWTQIGRATAAVDITFAPMFFGFAAAITEFFGGIFLGLGLFFYPTLILLIIEMIIITAMHISAGHPFSITSHSIELGIVFFSLLFIGSGKYSLDNKINKKRRRLF